MPHVIIEGMVRPTTTVVLPIFREAKFSPDTVRSETSFVIWVICLRQSFPVCELCQVFRGSAIFRSFSLTPSHHPRSVPSPLQRIPASLDLSPKTYLPDGHLYLQYSFSSKKLWRIYFRLDFRL